MSRSDDENYHGLVAESYDLFRGDDPIEQEQWFQFYKRRLKERPGLALEVGCGTGRVLLPFLKDGFPMEGVDSSSEMLAICRQKAINMGLEPVLYEQYMQELVLQKKYCTILIPLGSFILIGHHSEAVEALRRFHDCLSNGGQLVFSTPAPSSEIYSDSSNEAGTWSEPATVTRDADGAIFTLQSKGSSDSLEQVHRSLQRYEMRRAGKLIRAEEHMSVTRWYGMYELRLMLELAGFRGFKVYGDHTDEEATARSSSRVYWAEK